MASNGWTTYTLGEVTENHDSRRIPVKKVDRRPGPFPYYGASGVVDQVDKYIFDGEYVLVAEDGENLRTRNTPIAFIATGKFWVNNHAHIVRGNHLANTRFLCYALEKSSISGFLTGSTMPKLTQGNMNRISVTLPPRSVQDAIVGIVRTLDDKIELNRRMNETLEATARALFKSWFVDFDPVRAKIDGQKPLGMDEETAKLFPASFAHAELGSIPSGWETSSVGNEFHLTMGQSPPGSTYNEEGDGLPFFQGRRDFGFRFPARRVYCTAPTRFAEQGDTLVSVRAPVGDINMAYERCCVGRGVAAVRHNSGSMSYTYSTMHALGEDFARYEAEGTVFGAINKKNFEALEVFAPPANIVARFEEIAAPIDKQILCLSRQSLTLAALRDTLLPKLLSGEIRVAEAEKLAGEVS